VRFVSIAVGTYAHQRGGVVLYFAALDANGDAWFYDTSSPAPQWQRLPPHPGRAPTSGAVP
jgi:hypothetical protein